MLEFQHKNEESFIKFTVHLLMQRKMKEANQVNVCLRIGFYQKINIKTFEFLNVNEKVECDLFSTMKLILQVNLDFS